MKKVSIITKHSSFNFGAMLQAHALQATIKNLGADCRIINLRQSKLQTKWSNKSPSGIIRNFYYKLHEKELNEGFAKFEKFISEYDKTREYKNIWELYTDTPESDVYLTGSDQVFNPLNIEDSSFLRFAPKDKIRASYAASLGVSNIPNGALNLISEYINDLDYISVREETGKKALEKLTDKKINVHVDPTLLMKKEYWQSFSVKPNMKRPYILCYVLYRPDWLNSYLKKIRKQTKLDIVLVTSDPFRNVYHNKCIRNAGPKEFLGLIQNAEFVISSSFHGVALSIANQKPFYAVVNPNAPSRIIDLLSVLNLKHRIIKKEDKFNVSEIDYLSVENILEVERQKSYKYLSSLLLVDKTENTYKREIKIIDVSSVGDKCTGCTVCKSVCPVNAISMIEDKNGFYYPHIDREKCIDCGKCAKTCHALKVGVNARENSDFYFGHINDKKIRATSSSGGIFSALSKIILENGGVVFGAYFDHENKTIKHGCSDQIEFERFKRSKYVESQLGDTIEKIEISLKENKQVLFCGTPCQCRGLREKFKSQENLILIDFFCHGVPSGKVFRDYLIDIERKQKKKIADYMFRTKDFGWSNYGIDVVFENNKHHKTVGRNDWYFRATMLDNKFLRPSCYACDRNVYHGSDITIGDFWGVNKYNKALNDQKGISIIGINTKKGKDLLDIIAKDCNINNVSKEYIDYALKVKTNDKILEKSNLEFDKLNNLGVKKYVRKYYSKKLFISKTVFMLKGKRKVK